MTRLVADEVVRGDLRARIEATGQELRETITAVIEAAAGPRPRPTRLARAIGLDKSLASRLVRATQSPTDLDLMHLVPSPGGLQILADMAARHADPASIRNLRDATNRFEALLHSVPGGRASIDAEISESSQVALSRREHIAKQASFKSMSFLLGHFCDVLTTSLFLVPSANGQRVDGLELHRRVGLRRMRPSTPLALLSIWGEDKAEYEENEIRIDTLDGEPGVANPFGFLLPEFSSRPIPELDVVRAGEMTTLVLAGDPSVHAPAQLTSVLHIRNGWARTPEATTEALRGYVQHTPCVTLVRELHVAESLFPNAAPEISFLLPGPRAVLRPPRADGERHFSEVELTSSIEQLPAGSQTVGIPGVVNHGAAVRHVLERAGHGQTRFRGWRTTMTYPVPLIEMMWWLTHPSVNGQPKPTNGER